MKIIDRFCVLIGGCSAILLALSFLYVCGEIIISGMKGPPPGPPLTIFMALFGIFSAGLIYAGAHLIKGDFP